MSYIVIEIQTNADGSVGNFVWAYSDPKKTDNENELDAFAKYHAVLSAAAKSSLPVHSAVLLRNDAVLIAGQLFKHGEEDTNE